MKLFEIRLTNVGWRRGLPDGTQERYETGDVVANATASECAALTKVGIDFEVVREYETTATASAPARPKPPVPVTAPVAE